MRAAWIPETSAQVWWQHARWPARVFVGAALLFATTSVDTMIAGAVFFEEAGQRWRGAENWWINEVIHTGGRWAVRLVVVLALGHWIASFIDNTLAPLRRPAAYLAVAIVITVGIVGLLKAVTNVDCPWDLRAFGGDFPYVHLFAERPLDLRRAHCFPAAHAGSGYALMALYFVAYERSRRLALAGLVTGLLVGLIFGIAQQARGAHFASHDLWSAFLAWIVCLTVYVFVFRARLHSHAD